MSSLRPFGAFSPPPFRASPYTYAPPKRRRLPLLAAFGCGAVCVLAISALPVSRAYVTPTLRVYTAPTVPLPDGAFLAVAQPQPKQLPTKLQEERPLAQGDQPTISPSLKVIAEPIDTAQARQPVAKGRATTTRHVAHKSRRHERNDAYARAYGSRRNSYAGYGYASNRNSNWFY
jgi:hypothetical protein